MDTDDAGIVEVGNGRACIYGGHEVLSKPFE